VGVVDERAGGERQLLPPLGGVVHAPGVGGADALLLVDQEAGGVERAAATEPAATTEAEHLPAAAPPATAAEELDARPAPPPRPRPWRRTGPGGRSSAD